MKLVLGPDLPAVLFINQLALDTLIFNHIYMLVIHGPKYMHQTAIVHYYVQENMIDNRFPINEIRIHSSINCKQMMFMNVKMVDCIIIIAGFP